MEKIGNPFTDEVWTDLSVESAQEGYKVSSYGRVIDSSGNVVTWRDNGFGYKTVFVRNNAKGGKPWYVHRLVGLHFVPNPDNKPQVGHKDHNKENNHYENLHWVTQSENTREGVRDGRINNKKRGSTNKLTKDDIIFIAKKRREGVGVAEIARLLHYPRTTVSSVINGRSNKELFEFALLSEEVCTPSQN